MLAKINAGGFDTKCDLEIVYVNVAIIVRTVGAGGGWWGWGGGFPLLFAKLLFPLSQCHKFTAFSSAQRRGVP